MNKKIDHLKKALDEINNIDVKDNVSVLSGLSSIKQEIKSAIDSINKDDLFISNFFKDISKESKKVNLEISKLEDHIANRKPKLAVTRESM